MNIAELAIKRPVFVIMIVVAILTLGIIGYTSMGVDMLPDVEYPTISVVTVYEGASAEEIENLVTRPLEDALAVVEGLDTLSSSSRENVSEIVARFSLGADVKYAETRVRDAVNKSKWKLPDDADDPNVVRFSASEWLPVVALAVKGSRDIASLKEIVEDTVRPEIEKIQGVGRIELWGGRDRAVNITIDKKALAAKMISFSQIAEAVGRENIDYPAGSMEKDGKLTGVRVKGKFASIEDIENLNIASYDGRIVRLKDIAKVEFGLKKETRRSRIDSENAVLFGIYKQSGENTVSTARAIKKKLSAIRAKLPSGVTLELFRDPSIHIEESIKGLQEDILLGALAAMFIVWLFLGNVRSTLITAIALPNSLLGAFFFINYAGFTINMMVLLALSLSIGLLIDDSIVVRENIFRYIEKGMKPKDAAVKGTNEVALAVIATTLSIMAVFIPISFLQGMVGQFFKEFGVTIAFALSISLLDAFTTAPMLSAYWWKKAGETKQNLISKFQGSFEIFYEKSRAAYTKLLALALDHKKVVIISTLVLLIASIGAAFFIGMSFMPDSDYKDFEFTMEMKPGTAIDTVDAKLRQIEAYLKTVKDIEIYYTVAGWGEINRGRIYCSVREHGRNSAKVSDEVYSHIMKNMGTDIVLTKEDSGAGTIVSGGGDTFPITINITGPDMKTLEGLANQVKAITASVAGADSPDTSFRPGMPEITVQLDRRKAAELGISTYQAGLTLNTLINGKEISRYKKDDKEYGIILKLDENATGSLNELKDIMLTGTGGVKIPLSAIARFTTEAGPVEIKRENKKRIIKVTANIREGFAMGDVVNQAREKIKKEVTIPDGYEYSFGGQASQMEETMTQMARAMLLALLFMYMILASLYNSLTQPLILMLSVPLAIIGAFLALLITGQKMDIMAMIGLLMVLGLVAKNGILLIDFTNQMRQKGMNARDALLHAGPVRLRPILMTTFAMIFGMLPLAIGFGEGALRTKSMPIAVIGGLITSTFLTLIVIPVVYEWAEGISGKRKKAKTE